MVFHPSSACPIPSARYLPLHTHLAPRAAPVSRLTNTPRCMSSLHFLSQSSISHTGEEENHACSPKSGHTRIFSDALFSLLWQVIHRFSVTMMSISLTPQGPPRQCLRRSTHTRLTTPGSPQKYVCWQEPAPPH